MGQGRAQIYNLISLFFLALTAIMLVFVAARMAAPAPSRAPVVLNLPTVAVLPSPTDTFTPTLTDTATWTDVPTETITPTIAPTLTGTLQPTLTPSLTNTLVPTQPTNTTPPTDAPPTQIPSETITSTLVVTPTDIPTITPTVSDFTPLPTEPPPSPYPFILRDNQVIFTGNFANTAGCAWQGVGGQVFDLNGQPLLQIRVHVFGQGVDLYTASGSNTLYGLSGWEVPLNSTLTGNSYIVELQSQQGTIISPQVTVTYEANNCAKNLALINFEQTRPF